MLAADVTKHLDVIQIGHGFICQATRICSHNKSTKVLNVMIGLAHNRTSSM